MLSIFEPRRGAFRRSVLIGLIGVLVLTGIFSIRPAGAANKVDRAALERDSAKVNQAVETYGLTEMMGPLAPVALSPFFGLACLSGLSCLNILPENGFISGNEVLNNGGVFFLFAALAVITSLPKMMTVSKVFAEAADQLETYAGIISYGVILLAAKAGDGVEQQAQAVVFSAGIFSFTYNGLIAIAAAINIIVINTVKYFFELLVLISPIPTLDAIFECANKGVCFVLVAIYAFSPWLAMALNILLFLICLSIFRWANRRLRHIRAVMLEPILFGLLKKLTGKPDLVPEQGAMKRYGSLMPEGVAFLIKCFPSRRLGKIKKKDRCYLGLGAHGAALICPHLLTKPVRVELTKEQLGKEVKEGLFSYSIPVADPKSGKDGELIFGSVHKAQLNIIREKLASLSN